MTRTRAAALVLVNWRGIFYQRFLLDRHVTALEGANGSGKTTVMIAAYVVLLPDMSRLRFTNLGETGATGGDKGIWGRLGEPGRPSYAVLDFSLPDGRRLVAGVHLERKGEPSVEPTPFVITGLGSDVRLQELLLMGSGENEQVPELAELKENAARLGGRLQRCESQQEYFALLFDHGVTPLRLSTDEERNKLNEMLRTSMTGGISRALTSELRSFLLKEEGGLADTLQRMKANLDACRRTRTEVQESQRLEREIGGVFEAGQSMFAATFLATRERAEELNRRVAEAEAARQTAVEAFDQALLALQEVRQDLRVAEARQAECAGALAPAKVWLQRLKSALTAVEEVGRRTREHEEALGAERSAAADKGVAEEFLARQRADRARAQENHKRAASGVADLQRGLEELHRRAGEHRRVVRMHAEALRLLEERELPLDSLVPRLAECRARLVEVDRERRSSALRLADAEAHRHRYAEVAAALQALAGRDVESEGRYAAGLEQLRLHRDLKTLAERAPSISKELETERGAASRQQATRDRALGLEVPAGVEPANERVHAMLVGAEAQRALAEESTRLELGHLADMERRLGQDRGRHQELTQLEPRWRDLNGRAARLAARAGASISDRTTLDRVRLGLADELAEARGREAELSTSRERLYAQARELVASGGPFDPELLRLKDLLGADLVAGKYEEVGLEEAGILEATLGPLAQALVVDDQAAAARAVEVRGSSLPSVWLVGRDVALAGGEDSSKARGPAPQDVVVQEGNALRVTRPPVHPVLGRRARERRAAELRDEADQQSRQLEEVRSNKRAVERLLQDGEELLGELGLWLAGDPATEIVELRRRIVEAEAQTEVHRGAAGRHAEVARGLRPRIEALRGLLGEAFLLDPPDHQERAAALTTELQAAKEAGATVERTINEAATLESGLEFLRSPPLTPGALADLQARVDALRDEHYLLDGAIEALDHVVRNAEALAWGDAAEALRKEEALVPALQEQLARAEAAVERADQAVVAAEGEHGRALSAWQDSDGRRRVAWEQLDAAEARVKEIGVDDPTPADALRAQGEVDRLEREAGGIAGRLADLGRSLGRRESECTQAETKRKEAEEEVVSERKEATPVINRWERLRELAVKHHLLASVLEPGRSDVTGIRGHVNLVQEANSQRATLVERLRSAQGGPALLAEVEKGMAQQDQAFADNHLSLWLAVRDWLRRRLPAQISEVDDPREGLIKLHDQLTSLEERLNRQEQDLKGASEDVARGIDVQVRKARSQVMRLNKNLEGVAFGAIQGIRVLPQPVERMEQVLRALREGAAQGLLFQEDLPIEEALDEIFRRYGGGRTGGQRLLDYREYVHLQVMVRRNSSKEWESANPSHLSTGEAIGVGAALMMVVLTEWERDANLLRGKRTSGALRFLFLDEANRLDPKNLSVLFDLCRALDLQLLIAAPEVAHAEGNTTYRLVRKVTGEGREEVLVSGRRMKAEA